MTVLAVHIALIALVVPSFVACLDLPTPYRALDYHWDEKAFPVAVNLEGLNGVGTVPPDAAQSAGRNAMSSWSAALERSLFTESQGPNRIEVRALGVGEPPAYTSAEYIGEKYVSFTIVVNSSHPFSTADEGEAGAFDLETVIAHELGHALGLDHPVSDLAQRFGSYGELACLIPPSPTRLMCPRLAGQVMRSPGPDDVAGVQAIYGW